MYQGWLFRESLPSFLAVQLLPGSTYSSTLATASLRSLSNDSIHWRLHDHLDHHSRAQAAPTADNSCVSFYHTECIDYPWQYSTSHTKLEVNRHSMWLREGHVRVSFLSSIWKSSSWSRDPWFVDCSAIWRPLVTCCLRYVACPSKLRFSRRLRLAMLAPSGFVFEVVWCKIQIMDGESDTCCKFVLSCPWFLLHLKLSVREHNDLDSNRLWCILMHALVVFARTRWIIFGVIVIKLHEARPALVSIKVPRLYMARTEAYLCNELTHLHGCCSPRNPSLLTFCLA